MPAPDNSFTFDEKKKQGLQPSKPKKPQSAESKAAFERLQKQLEKAEVEYVDT